ncbi:MAG: response regulator transcription factor [Saprospiraceae bacterium]
MMTKTVLLFGFCMAVLLALLKWAEYSFFAKDLALEAYIGIVGLFCTVLGGWIGWNLTRPKINSETEELNENIDVSDLNGFAIENKFGLSPREYEVLVLIAQGYSYQEIADQLFLSITTVKTHASNIFSKMDVRRRTQAVMLGQKTGLLPPLKV